MGNIIIKQGIIKFRLIKISSKPTKVSFYTKDDKEVNFNSYKDIPNSVKIELGKS